MTAGSLSVTLTSHSSGAEEAPEGEVINQPVAADSETSAPVEQLGQPVPRRAVPLILVGALAGCGVSAGLSGTAAIVTFAAVQVGLLVALAVGLARNRPSPLRPWLLIAVGIGLMAVTNLVLAAAWLADRAPESMVMADAVVLASYLPILAGLVGLARLRRGRQDMDAVIDATVVAAAGALLCWQLLVQPWMDDGSSAIETQSLAAAFPVLDVILLVIAGRLAVTARDRVVSWWLLFGGMALALPVDVFHAIGTQSDSAPEMWRLLNLMMVARVFVVGSVLHPSMRELTARRDPHPTPMVRRRAALLLVPLISGPILLLVNPQLGEDEDIRIVAVLSMVMAVLVVARLAQLAWEVASVRDRERSQEQWFESLVRNAKDAILVLDHQARLTWISPAVESMLGYEPTALLGRSVSDFLHPENRSSFAGLWSELVADAGGSRQWQFRVRHASGEWRRLEAHLVNLLHDKHVQGIVINERDITDWHDADVTVRHRAAQQEAVAALGQRALEGAEPVELADEAVRHVRANLEVDLSQFFRTVPDVEDERVLLDAASAGDGINPGTVGVDSLPARSATLAGFTMMAGTPVISGDATEDRFEAPAAPGSLPIESTMSVSVTGRNRPHGVLVVRTQDARLFTASDALFLQAVANALALALERRQAEDQTRHQALHDTLTGLPNRALFMDRLHQALARSQRNRSSMGVLFLDLDHFKVVNDSLGHDAGDRLLVAVARRLENIVRPGDTVARFGGDEFTILCESIAGTHEAVEIAERINAMLATPLAVGPAEMHTTASIGISVSGAVTRPEALLRDADAAMYRAKEHGRARFEVFDATMRDRAVTRLRTETALRRALASDELELHYQPVLDLRSDAVVGAEALIRWNHPERGLIMPGEFIPVAEETGLIDAVTQWVLEGACHQAAAWAAAGDNPGMVVAVNVSARALSTPQFDMVVQRALEDHRLDPSLLCLEITESVLMGNVEVSLAALRRLKELGIAIAVDDFGTGYSSLAYLKRFPVDVLKVDRSFVDGLGKEAEDSAIAAAIVTLARTLGLIAIAEGVETELQLGELTHLGCDLAQGFYFSPPAPVNLFASRVAAAPSVFGGRADPRTRPPTGVDLRTNAHRVAGPVR